MDTGIHTVREGQLLSVLRSRSRWSRNYLRPGAGAEIIHLINISYSQFGGYYDKKKPPLRQISYSTTVLVKF